MNSNNSRPNRALILHTFSCWNVLHASISRTDIGCHRVMGFLWIQCGGKHQKDMILWCRVAVRHSHGEWTVTWITPPWSCGILVRTELLNDFLQMVTSRDGVMRWHQWRSVSCVCICCCQLGICACVYIILPHKRFSQVLRAPLSEQIVQRRKVCANVLLSLSCRLPSPGIWEVLISVKVGNRGVSKLRPSCIHPPTHTHTHTYTWCVQPTSTSTPLRNQTTIMRADRM